MRAQDIIPCYLCESETNLKWKCLDCDLLMCINCNDKIHPKFKNANEHTIVDIKDVALGDANRIMNFTNVKCKAHKPQLCCLFCSNCDDLVCPICIAKIHAGHTFIEIREAYVLKLEKLKTIKMKMENAEKRLTDDKKKLAQLKITENTKGKIVLKDIQTLKDEFNKNADQLTEKVQQMMKVSDDFLSREEKQVIGSRQKVQEVFREVDDLINSKDTLQVFEYIDKVEKSLKVGLQPNIQLWNSYIPKFLPRRRDSSSVGSLTVDKVELRVNKQYITELKYCHSMSMCSDYLLWLNDCVSSVLMKVKLDEENITITNIKTTIRGFAITTDSDILLADATPRLKLLSGQNGKSKESKYSVVSLTIISVCITREHRVVVGAESWSNYTCHRKTSGESNG